MADLASARYRTNALHQTHQVLHHFLAVPNPRVGPREREISSKSLVTILVREVTRKNVSFLLECMP